MIRVNLLNREVDNTQLYLVQIAGYLLCLGLAFGACTFLGTSTKSKLASLTTEQEDLNRVLTRLKKETSKVEGLEEKKKVLRQKLMTISLLKAKKYGPVRVLDDLNTAVPERAWLSNVEETESQIQIGGVALDDQTVSTFMVNLQESAYFSDIDLLQSKEMVKDGVMLREFTLTAKLVDYLKLQKSEEGSESGEEGLLPESGPANIDPPA